jgi:hypothetical protein
MPPTKASKTTTSTKPARRESEPAQLDEDISIRGIYERYNASITRRNSDRAAIPEPGASISGSGRPDLGPDGSIDVPSPAVTTTTESTSSRGMSERARSPQGVMERPRETFLDASSLLHGVGSGLALLSIAQNPSEQNKKRGKSPSPSSDEDMPRKRVKPVFSSAPEEITSQNISLNKQHAESETVIKKRARAESCSEDNFPPKKRVGLHRAGNDSSSESGYDVPPDVRLGPASQFRVAGCRSASSSNTKRLPRTQPSQGPSHSFPRSPSATRASTYEQDTQEQGIKAASPVAAASPLGAACMKPTHSPCNEPCQNGGHEVQTSRARLQPPRRARDLSRRTPNTQEEEPAKQDSIGKGHRKDSELTRPPGRPPPEPGSWDLFTASSLLYMIMSPSSFSYYENMC